MMTQLSIDVQLIVYKHLHKSTLTDTHHDMMNQLKSKCPYLRATGYRSECFDKKLECRIVPVQIKVRLYYDEFFIRVWEKQKPGSSSNWLYPYWYYLTSDHFKNTRTHHNFMNLKLY